MSHSVFFFKMIYFILLSVQKNKNAKWGESRENGILMRLPSVFSKLFLTSVSDTTY